MNKIAMPVAVYEIILLSCITIVVCIITSIFSKINTHTLGIGGLLGFITYAAVIGNLDVGIFAYAVILVSGLLTSSLLLFNKYRSIHVYSSFILGFISVFIILFILYINV